ncbi:MAG: hypothetical protein HY848_12870 [Betaproteobacteria bacterium]|nr:hypothetical protein [Betaproteobacteria bacterium]
MGGLLLAQAIGAGTATDAGVDAQQPQPSAAADAASGAAADAASGAAADAASGAIVGVSPPWFGWGLPPVRWGGSMATDIRMNNSGNNPRRLQRIESANIKGASYIWQPWFAQVSGGLGLLVSQERQSAGAGLSAEQAHSTRSNAVTGNAEATLFPVSRFPFNAYFDVSDSRASGELTSGDITSTRFGMRQSYRPLEGGDNYSASFNRSTLESQSFGRDTVNALAASMNRDAGPQSFNLSGSHTGNTRSDTGERTAFSQINGRHSYRPEPELSVESLASLSSSDFRLLSAGVPTENRSNFAQANTFATWRPEEDSPLYVTGGARMFRSAIANSATQTQSLTLGANLAATYALSRQTSLAASVSVTQLLTDAASRLVTTQTAYATRIGDPVGIFGANYTWNTGANVSNQTGLVEGMRQNLGGQFGHNLNRSLNLGENSQANFGLGQSVGASFDSVTAGSQSLGHNASASWRLSRGAATSAYVSLIGADSISSGQNQNHFQLLNFQASGQVQFSRNASVAANLTVQGVRQATPNTPRTGMTFNTSGNLSYFQQRAFDVPRLRYSALYSANESRFKSRLQGDIDAPRERVNQSFEQRLDYNIGRVALGLSMRFAQVEGRRDAMIFFRMMREFGGY